MSNFAAIRSIAENRPLSLSPFSLHNTPKSPDAFSLPENDSQVSINHRAPPQSMNEPARAYTNHRLAVLGCPACSFLSDNLGGIYEQLL